MGRSKIKRVFILGAGFSAPASLPIQGKIIKKMIEKPKGNFLSNDIKESKKFIHAYITVGLYLLSTYSNKDYSYIEKKYDKICKSEQVYNIFLSSFDQSQVNTLTDEKEQQHKIIESQNHLLNYSFRYADYINANGTICTSLYEIREAVRAAIEKEKINVDLEDIFTLFDKSVLTQQNVYKYSYSKINQIKYSIMRLFIYYFSDSVLKNKLDQQDYSVFINYLKHHRTYYPITIITTNWDTLIEEYFKKYRIKYSYGFRSPYTSQDIQVERSNETTAKQSILLLKIHGSTNWLKCLHCGAISVYNDNKAAESLFTDDKEEKCQICDHSLNSASSLQPEIITPTMLKSLTSRLYSNLWGEAARNIREATEITFIGYSLPIADFEFRYMLQKNISPSTKINVVLYKDDDPAKATTQHLKDLLPERRYRDTFPKNKFYFSYEGFRCYFQK